MVRDLKLKELRPQLGLESREGMTDLEHFQNKTLRPILKLQHELSLNLLMASKNFNKRKAPMEKPLYSKWILSFLNTDLKFRNTLLGVIIGQFTLEEFSYYILHASELNKRIVTMQAQRYLDTHFSK